MGKAQTRTVLLSTCCIHRPEELNSSSISYCKTSMAYMKFEMKLLRYLSYSMSAPVIAIIAFVTLAVLVAAQLIIILLSIAFATVIPTVGIPYSARSERLNYDIPEKSARTRPFIVAIASYLFGFAVLVWIRAPFLMSGLMMAYTINTFIIFLITLRWKISVHAAGLTGPITFVIYRLGLLWSFLYLLVIPVGLVRLKLREHTTLQVVAGAILSALLTWIEIILLVPLIQSQ
jgi:hypothetical protein